MSRISNWLMRAVKLAHAVKDEHLRWQLANHEQLHRLKSAQALAEQALAGQLQQQAAELAQQLELLKTKHDTQLNLYRRRCQQDIKDYQQYLDALAQLKRAIQNSYPQLPEALAFTIHHHAKQLLNRMWEEQDFQQKNRLEMELLHFMTAVHEDARRQLSEANRQDAQLPAKTLALLQQR